MFLMKDPIITNFITVLFEIILNADYFYWLLLSDIFVYTFWEIPYLGSFTIKAHAKAIIRDKAPRI